MKYNVFPKFSFLFALSFLFTGCAKEPKAVIETSVPEIKTISLLRMEIVTEDSDRAKEYGTSLQEALQEENYSLKELIISTSNDSSTTMEKLATGEIDLAVLPQNAVRDECIVLLQNDTTVIALSKADEALFNEDLTNAFTSAVTSLSQK